MMQFEQWADLCEVSTNTLDELKENTTTTTTWDDTSVVFHLYRPHHPLASTMLQPMALDYYSGIDVNSENHSSTVRLHPFLFEFLIESSKLVDDDDDDETKIQPQSTVPEEGSTNSIPVRIQPLPIEPLIRMGVVDEENDQFCNGFQLRAIQTVDSPSELNNNGNQMIVVSCIYADFDIDDNESDKNQKRIAEALQGRIVMEGCVVLLPAFDGLALLKIESIQTDGMDAKNVSALRLGTINSFQVQVRYNGSPLAPIEQFLGDDEGNSENKIIWSQDIPGYEPLLDDVVRLLNSHGNPAAPSGILLLGCSGVGKSRLASCVGHHYSTNNISKKNRNEVYLLSLHDLFFRAATTNDLFQEILLPRLKQCSLWIIDGLSLLNQNGSDGDDESPKSVEYVSVLNALTRALDIFHTKCRIVGVGQNASSLPNELTKIGRLEKTIEIMAPTQVQRQEIWKSILQNVDIDDSAIREQWISTLVVVTAGCVASDLWRVYETARTRALARSSKLRWEDLREAARSCVPSQLAELDVIKPKPFEPGMGWPEMDRQSWAQFGGYAAVKKQVYRNVVTPWKNFLRRMDAPQSQEGGNWLAPPSGVLFHGPSGCGKSMAARCMADSLQLPMVQIRATDVLNKYLGGSEALLRSVFARARASSPCILFIDEIDSISNNRSEDDSNELGARILSTLLNEMDGVSSSKNNRVLVVACSNRLEAIDSALLRSGRLEEHLYLGPPVPADLVEILKLQTNRMPLDERLNLNTIAEQLFDVEATPADVEGLCRDVCFVAFRRLNDPEDTVITPKDFEQALQTYVKHKS